MITVHRLLPTVQARIRYPQAVVKRIRRSIYAGTPNTCLHHDSPNLMNAIYTLATNHTPVHKPESSVALVTLVLLDYLSRSHPE